MWERHLRSGKRYTCNERCSFCTGFGQAESPCTRGMTDTPTGDNPIATANCEFRAKTRAFLRMSNPPGAANPTQRRGLSRFINGLAFVPIRGPVLAYRGESAARCVFGLEEARVAGGPRP